MSKQVMRQALDALELNTTIEGGYCSCCGHQPCLKTCSVIQAIDALRAALDAPEPDIGRTLDQFLCNGTRIKLNFNRIGNMTSLQNMAHDLQGRWVALVPAENDCHLKRTEREPLSDAPAAWEHCFERGKKVLSYTKTCAGFPPRDDAIQINPLYRAIEQEVRGK